ncbi:MAG: hypothetical protein K2M67_01945 [Muribaculaceae bacterium]|nr:hypothetical protein [Muribaculaceae bacterium]
MPTRSRIWPTVLKWVLLSAMLCYLVWISFWAHSEAARHKCVGIDVRIASATSADSITKRGVLDELEKYKGKIIGAQLNTINTADIQRYLTSFSNFESVECVLTPGGELRVNIVPMIPEIRVFGPDGSYYVNKDGKRINSNAEFFVDVPVVKGNFTKMFPASTVLPLVRFISSDPKMKDLVAMIDARDAHNLILVPRIHGHVINFGDTTRLAEKRDMLLLMYRRVMPYKGWSEYDTISVKFRGQIVATRRDKTPVAHSEEFLEDIDLEEATLPTAEQAVLATRPNEKLNVPAPEPADTPNP